MIDREDIAIQTPDQVEEGMKENLISLALSASLLAIPNILKASDIERAVKGNPTAIQEFQKVLRTAEVNKQDKFGGYTLAQAANILARTIYKEGRSEGHEGRHHIATVIYNRSGKDRNKMVSVCFKPSAFSVWNAIAPSTTSGKYAPASYRIVIPASSVQNKAEEEAWTDAKAIASELMTGKFVPDGNYNSYYNPKKVTPSWSTKMTGVKDVVNHKFGYLTSEDPSRKVSTGKQKKQIYTVANGDLGVSFIAKKVLNKYQGETVQSLTDKIMQINNFKGKNPIIKVGQKIILPPMT